ncbi:SMR domain-containing protein At5g58720-like isoform X2 [Phragmites australis]|uniref:SMR domain-containing protein At5g58720-like isoform X2 n=1 Tax=Phragmites australis TaxID=29695 RepID=UPI002D777662|nr:SMR domain-containing protein At5g58720-like isoform X2 [Phragmites australis]
MKPSKKKSSKKKKPSPAIPAHPAGVADSSGDSCSPGSETLTLAAAAASETESSSSCEASTYTSAFTSGTASTSSFSAFSSSASTASSSAAGGDERRDLAWLLDAFASATIDQVDSAYRETGGDPFLAAGVLGSSQDTQPPQPPQPAPQPPPPPDLSPRGGSGRKKAGRRPKRLAVAATGMVAGVIGKDYTRSATPVSVTNACKGRDGEGDGGCGGRKYSVEEAEQFLCSMLGDNSDLGMGVVRDVLGQYVYDVEKSSDEISTRMKLQSELEHGFLWGEHRISYAEAVLEVPRSATSPSRSTAVKTNPQQVLESLFKIPEIRTYEPSSMDWKKVVKKLQSFNSTIASNNQERPKIGDGYREFRGVAARHYDTMKEYYQRAALAYSKGDKSYASYLADEGKHYRELARMEDEKASRKIFDARNKHITNTVTIDLHGQHVKQAMRLLKIHMMICVCMPSVLLRVITGCGSEGSGKGKIKRTVIELVEKEHIEWREENSGTIVLRLGGPREYGFLENDSDTD